MEFLLSDSRSAEVDFSQEDPKLAMMLRSSHALCAAEPPDQTNLNFGVLTDEKL